jgi:mono/diheme cytochrome c family protein
MSSTTSTASLTEVNDVISETDHDDRGPIVGTVAGVPECVLSQSTTGGADACAHVGSGWSGRARCRAAATGRGRHSASALGAPIYVLHCSSCHGVQGQGIDAPPLRDSQYVGTKSKQEVFSTIADGRTGTEMPAWLVTNGGSLTDVEISRVIAYLCTWQGVPPLPTSTPVPEEPTETPLPPDAPTPEPAQPSLPGGPGPAASLAGEVDRGQSGFGLFCAVCHSAEGVGGVPNPGSDDGTVPELNPIDPTIENPDPKVFAANVDLFIEHGSVPDGPSPMIMMPSFGDAKMLTDQEIADLIAYVISLNATEAAP